MKSIVLAEKPSVAKEFARILKCTKAGKGYFEGNQYIVTWALGHLVTLAEPAEYDQKYKEWRLEHLPMLPEQMKLKVMGKTSHQFRVVTQLMKRNDVNLLIIATDAGREGELVARWIMKLGSWKKPVKRLWISSQTDAAVTKGFAELKAGDAYLNLYRAAVCRAEADWLIGLNVTRALTCKFDAQLSAGRVQTPTLAMIIQREEEITDFKPVDYWMVNADFGDYYGTWRNKTGNSRIFKQEDASKIQAAVMGTNGIIRDVRVEAKSEPPPLAYDLTELQRDANRRFGFSAKHTLSVLQGLYEHHKLVTYPRTDSRCITADMKDTLPLRLDRMGKGPYASLVKKLKETGLSITKRLVNDAMVSDHHAIIPTEQPLELSRLDNDQRKLYDLIARRFIVVLSAPYLYDQTTIVTEVDGNFFYARGKVEKSQGWRAVSGAVTPVAEDLTEDQKETLPTQTLSHQQKGAQKAVKNCKLKKSQTQPPPRYTEATLLTAMESPGKFIDDEKLRESIKAGGLGTPATRAEIIEKLLSTYYVERNGRELVPTSKGKQLIQLVPPELKSPELTAQWELRLNNIAKGKENDRNFMTDIRQNAVQLVKVVKADTSVFKLDNLTKHKCQMCGSFMMSISTGKEKKQVCSDRKCGHEQTEGSQEFIPGDGRRQSRKEKGMNRQLIERFSDNKKKIPIEGGTLGDLFEKALGKK